MKRLFPIILCAVILISAVPLQVFAHSVEPYAYPTITSRICPTCGSIMQKVSTEYEYQQKRIQSILCPNSPYADESAYHTHTYRRQYDNYECPSCGTWGRMFIESIMYKCSLSGSDAKNNEDA